MNLPTGCRVIPHRRTHPRPACCRAGEQSTRFRSELNAMRWGQQFRFFRDEVIAAMLPVGDGEVGDTERDES
jgi:hypothetical protein